MIQSIKRRNKKALFMYGKNVRHKPTNITGVTFREVKIKLSKYGRTNNK